MSVLPAEAKKVLYATFETIPAPTGTACWSTEVIRELAGHMDLDSLSLKSEDLSHIERYHGSRLLRVPVSEERFLDRVKTFQRALNRQLDSEEYDCCQFTSIWEGMVLATLRKAQGFRLIYQVHSLPSLDFRADHPGEAREVEISYSLKQQEERCFDAADRLLAGSGLIREHLIRRGVPARKIALVPAAVDLAPFEAVADRPGQAGTILYLGSLRPWQGVVSLLQALTELPRHLRVKLLLVVSRDDPGFNEVLGKIQMLGLMRSVEIIEPLALDQLAALVGQAAICVAPLANHEHNRVAASVPHKVLVYMACGRPVIAAQQPALRGLLQSGSTALTYAPGDTLGLVDALKRLLLDRDLATRLGNQARLFLEDHHSLEQSLEVLRDVYRDLLGVYTGSSGRRRDDTQPSLVSPDPAAPFASEPETRPVPAEALPASAGKFTVDTAPVVVADARPPGMASSTADTDAELVFELARDEHRAATGEASKADQWQVLEAGEIQLAEPGKKAPGGENPDRPTTRRRRYLLGAPSFEVEQAAEPPPARRDQQATERGARPPLPDSGPQLLSDDEVELLESPGARPPPASRAKDHDET